MTLKQRAASWFSRALRGLLRRTQRAAGAHDSGARNTPQEVYLFVAINGAGLGHLTRCLAIARRLAQRKPQATLVFFTTSLATVIVHRFGYPCFHIPPFAQVEGRFIESRAWNDMFANHLGDVVQAYQPDCLVFDGTYAYGGLQQVVREHPRMACVWVRRQGNPDKHRQALAQQAGLFHKVLVPADLGATAMPVQDQAAMVPPVVLLRPDELLSREAVRQQLHLPLDHKVVYVQLGAGNINEVDVIEQTVCNVLQRVPGLTIVMAASPIALRVGSIREGVRHISHYPNSAYFNAFDFAVVAAGYNSVIECVAHGLPAIFVPNQATQSDDQQARAVAAAQWDGFSLWSGVSEQEFAQQVEELCQRSQRARADIDTDGAEKIAAQLVELAAAR